jgi:hypothetical protein
MYRGSDAKTLKDGALVFAGSLFVCALAVQKASRNKIGMRCWIFINGSIQGHTPALGCHG